MVGHGAVRLGRRRRRQLAGGLSTLAQAGDAGARERGLLTALAIGSVALA
jgi:hypothetical protein